MEISVTYFKSLIVTLIFLTAVHAEAYISDEEVQKFQTSVVTVYVEGAAGKSVTTATGLVLDPSGLVVTSGEVVRRWLDADGSSIIVRSGDNVYYRLERLLSVDRENDIAILKIGPLESSFLPVLLSDIVLEGRGVYILERTSSGKAGIAKSVIIDPRGHGTLKLDVSSGCYTPGSPVTDFDLKVVGIVTSSGMATSDKIAALIKRWEETKRTSGLEDESRGGFKKALVKVKVQGGSAQSYLLLGRSYAREGMYNASADAFRSALEVEPNLAEAFNGLGAALSRMGGHEEAVRAFKRAVEIEPDYSIAMANLALAYGDMGRFSEAAEAFESLAVKLPGFAGAYYGMGVVYESLGRHKEASDALTVAIGLDPDYAEAYNALGVSYALEGRYADAIDKFALATDIRPGYAKAHFNLALGYMKAGDPDSMISQYSLLIRLQPELAEKLFYLLDSDSQDRAREITEAAVSPTAYLAGDME